MGIVETQAHALRRLRDFQRGLLMAAAGGGLILMGAIPNPILILKYFAGRKNNAQFRYQVKTTLGRLAKQQLVYFETRSGKRYARPTEAGTRALELVLLNEKPKPKRWDKRWRVVIFDIPERRRAVRNALRTFMEQYGFVRLQDSVWIYPYDCEDLIALAKAQFRLGASVLYMVVEAIERDIYLRRHFSLAT